MAGKTLLFKSNYAVSSRIEPFYKGGKVQVSADEQHIFCTYGPKINILQISTGKIIHSIEQEDQEDITAFALSPDDEMLVSASRALLLRQWDWKQQQCRRSWRAVHSVPVASMSFDCTSTLLATGGCDGTIKLWDVIKQYCTHNLKGSSGVVHLVEFHPDISRLQLFSSSSDCAIRIWDLRSSRCVCVLESHYSPVTALAFSPDGHTLVSSGRDKICSVWDLQEQKVKRTIPVYEAVEGVVLLSGSADYSEMGVKSDALHLVTAGSKGVLRVWDSSSSRCVFTQTLPDASSHTEDEDAEDEERLGLLQLLLLPRTGRLITVTAEHNILLYQTPTLAVQQQFVGYNDDVLDVKFVGKDDTHIAVATNSSQLKVFELSTNSCQILHGHTDTILSIDVFRKGSMFATCAKDKSVRVWRMDVSSGRVHCVAQGTGHSNAVGSIACSRMKQQFVVSGSQDCTVKVWDLPETTGAEGVMMMKARSTERAHEKDVNSVCVSPNDKLLASGSQDRTAKLWALSDLRLLGVCRGHRREVWSVQFSPVDQILGSASADGSVRIWSIQDFSCLKTFEGHDASVLKIIFVSRGTQLVSSGSDGLVKLWTIKTNECVRTLDAHQDKVWALHGGCRDELMVTGSADSTITVWKDVTEVELAEEQAKQEDQVLKQQELQNLLHEHQYVKALGVAISLDQPHTALRVIREIRQREDGVQELEKTLLKLRKDQKESVLRYCTVWNTNSRSCLDAQAVLKVLLTHLSPEEMLQFQSAHTHLQALVPYTERHMQRINRLLQASMFLDYMWQKMRITGAMDSVNMQEDEDDDGVQSVFITDKQPMQTTEEEEENEEMQCSGDSEQRLHEDEAVCTSKTAAGKLPNTVDQLLDSDEDKEEEEFSCKPAASVLQEIVSVS